MLKLFSLVKRNCLVFLRDRGAVFFSLMSMFIVLLLMVVFLGDMNVDSLIDLLKKYGGIRDAVADKENAIHLVQMWTIAGILVVNAVTVTLTVIGVMVNDSNENRLQSFYTAPVSKLVIALSYIISAVIIGTLFCSLTFLAAEGYVYATGGLLLNTVQTVKVLGYIVLNVCVFAVIMYLAALFVKSTSAWSGVATIVGTLVGFVGAIYLPMGSLPQSVGNVLKYLPILHGTALMREVCCEKTFENTFINAPIELIDTYKEHMGITIIMNDVQVSSTFQLLFVAGCGIIAIAVIAVVLRVKSGTDR